jgi:hypothetical protein
MSSRPHLKTAIWVDALIRRAQVAGAHSYVMTRGDRDAGSVLVVVTARDSVYLYTPERDMDGQRVWRGQAMAAEALAKTIAARLNFDPDLTVVEIEDTDGRHFITEPVIDAGPAAIAPGSPQPRPDAPSEDRSGPDQSDALAAAKALFRDQ